MKNKKNIRSSDPQLERESELYESPIPSRELILQVMEEKGVPVKKIDLIKILEIQDKEIILTLKLKSEDKKAELPLDFTFKKVEDNWRIDRIAKVIK